MLQRAHRGPGGDGLPGTVERAPVRVRLREPHHHLQVKPTVSISLPAWFFVSVQDATALDPVPAQGTIFMVGAMLSCFFEW
jgi:hypothetical protein